MEAGLFVFFNIHAGSRWSCTYLPFVRQTLAQAVPLLMYCEHICIRLMEKCHSADCISTLSHFLSSQLIKCTQYCQKQKNKLRGSFLIADKKQMKELKTLPSQCPQSLWLLVLSIEESHVNHQSKRPAGQSGQKNVDTENHKNAMVVNVTVVIIWELFIWDSEHDALND